MNDPRPVGHHIRMKSPSPSSRDGHGATLLVARWDRLGDGGPCTPASVSDAEKVVEADAAMRPGLIEWLQPSAGRPTCDGSEAVTLFALAPTFDRPRNALPLPFPRRLRRHPNKAKG